MQKLTQYTIEETSILTQKLINGT